MKSIAWIGLGATLVSLGLMGAIDRPDHWHQDGSPYHTAEFRSAYGGLPDSSNTLFTGSGKCAGCHGKDPNSFASIAGQTFPAQPMPDGWDVNVTDYWRSTLMANSARDPFWRAKVRHEVLVNPDHQLELEDKCTSCHAPLGHFAAHHDGEPHYTMAALLQDSLALDGVSCVACHQQAPTAGDTHSGNLEFDDSLEFNADMFVHTYKAYGPYGLGKDEPPLYELPMMQYAFYKPLYGEHVPNGEVCAGCHTLVTHATDLEGNYTGIDYVEQATYHEWLNSTYAPDGEEPATCNTCHMPRIDDPVIISSGYVFLEPRTPYGLHSLVGGNAQMLEIMRDNTEALGLETATELFDSTLQRTRDMLRNETVDLNVTMGDWIDAWGATCVVQLTNKAGHKFPSGYPARRAWIEVKASQNGEVIWHSGGWENGSITGVDESGLAEYEPHHTVINDPMQVQIYELVAADVEGNPTNVLERAASSLKDNRLTPKGFSYSHPVYDTTRVEGLALDDALFEVGQGRHTVTYEMGGAVGSGPVDMEVTVWYQAMPPRWVEPMFAFEDSTIQAFQAFFEAQGAAPELVADTAFTVNVVGGVGGTELESTAWAVYPNPTDDGWINLQGPVQRTSTLCEVFDAKGSRVASGWMQPGSTQALQLPAVKGHYVVRWTMDSGETVSRKVVRR